MKRSIYIFLIFFILLWAKTEAQVTIGSSKEPNIGAILDIDSDTKRGLLLPRVSLSNVSSWSPLAGDVTEGMVVFNTNTSTDNGLKGKGTYVWFNAKWNRMHTVYTCTSAPTPPSSINFNTRIINKNKNELFIIASVPEVMNAGKYNWTLPAGLNGQSNENYITISGTATGTYPASGIKVSVTNSCGNSAQISGTGDNIVVN